MDQKPGIGKVRHALTWVLLCTVVAMALVAFAHDLLINYAPAAVSYSLPVDYDDADTAQAPHGTIVFNVARCYTEILAPVKPVIDYTSTRRLFNDTLGTMETLVPSTNSALPGCHTEHRSSVALMNGKPAGRYHLDGLATVDGAWRTHLVYWYTEDFDWYP